MVERGVGVLEPRSLRIIEIGKGPLFQFDLGGAVGIEPVRAHIPRSWLRGELGTLPSFKQQGKCNENDPTETNEYGA